jgi:hypothetical protein
MRIYIIGNDGVTLCREPPTAVNASEIAVASNEKLHAAALNGKRLLALWNALPGVEKRWKVGDREALIDQLWSAIEALPEPEPPSDAKHRPENPAEPMVRRLSAGGRRIRTLGPTSELISSPSGTAPALFGEATAD